MHVSELSRLTATLLITITYLSFQEQKWLKDGIGTLSIGWNRNRYFDCCRYLLYDNEAGWID